MPRIVVFLRGYLKTGKPFTTWSEVMDYLTVCSQCGVDFSHIHVFATPQTVFVEVYDVE